MIRTLGTSHAELEVRMANIEAAVERLRVETAAAMQHTVDNTRRIAAAMDAEIAKVLAEVKDLIGAPPEAAAERQREATLGGPQSFKMAAE